MRVSSNAVRLAALVLAATAAGYLWRAAFEPSARTPTIIRLAPATRPEVPAQPVRQPPAGHRVAPKRARPHVTAVHHRPVVTTVADRVAAPVQHRSRPAPGRPVSKPKPKPSPAPAPAPAPTQPAPSGSQPSPPPPESTQQPVATAPVPAPAPEPSSEPPTESTEASKPGWGHGDKNHDHDGPHGGKHG